MKEQSLYNESFHIRWMFQMILSLLPFFLFSSSACKRLTNNKVLPPYQPVLLQTIDKAIFTCDSVVGQTMQVRPLNFNLRIDSKQVEIEQKFYHKIFDLSREEIMHMGYIRWEGNQLYYLFSKYQEIPSHDSGSKEQVFLDFEQEVGTKREIKGFGALLPFHQLLLHKKEYDPHMADTIFHYQCPPIPFSESSHAHEILAFSFGKKSGFIRVTFTSENKEEEFCVCRLQTRN